MRVGERHSGRRELNQLEDGVAHQDHEGHEHLCVCVWMMNRFVYGFSCCWLLLCVFHTLEPPETRGQV